MKETIDYSQIPNNYLICLHRECPKADNCLRHLAAEVIPSEVKQLNIINPKYLASFESDCTCYKAAEKMRYAKGFVKMLENMPYKQMQHVSRSLIAHFGRMMYFRMRKGDRLLSPAEQQSLLVIVGHCGISQPQDFDEYIENYEW
ncbi:MAG: DUF6078 family protein [Prevotellaceae bacterium]|jgi:hypothetical protein|nr:DUF6078 family protein [Prevotellaceae bacterium]